MLDFQNDILNSNLLDFQIFAQLESEKLQKQAVGENEKKLLIVSNHNENGAELIQLLQKILAAVQHDLAKDCLHLQLQSNQQFSFTELCKNQDIQTGIFFGIIPQRAGLNFNFSAYQPLFFQEKTFLFAHDLKEINQQPSLKKQLWGALQAMFLNK